jgi:hypothetical protein
MPPTHFWKIYFNIIIISTPRSSKWFSSLRFLHQNPVRTSPFLHTRNEQDRQCTYVTLRRVGGTIVTVEKQYYMFLCVCVCVCVWRRLWVGVGERARACACVRVG